MRAIEFLTEYRRNPEQNVRVSGWDQFVNIYNQYKQQGDVDSLYVSLTELEKLGINPLSEHETPNGVYAYPAEFVYQTKSFKDLPYAGDQKWVNVFSVNPAANVIRIDSISKEERDSYLQQLISKYPEQSEQIKQLAKEAPKTAFADDGWDDVPGRKSLKKLPGAQLWYVTFELSDWNSNLWTKLFLSMGIDGVIDSGKGIIHHMEPIQAVFFNPKAIKMVSRFPNSTYDEKSISRRRAAGQERTQTKRDINSVSEKEQIAWLKSLHNYENFDYIRNPSPAVQKAAVMLSPHNILSIKNPSPDLVLYAVKKEPWLVDSFPNQTPELQLAAIGKKWENIDYIDNPLPETVEQVLRMIPPNALKQMRQDQIEYANMNMENPYPWLKS